MSVWHPFHSNKALTPHAVKASKTSQENILDANLIKYAKLSFQINWACLKAHD
jgi:hypothetical protein